ncbi:LSU ribosomal protein L23p (L23Ae) [hydrothermal vent metagenome]|uniref:LSU ribosomal protein L23p (L23Ae) n=1 Tax=hydrothermal vent metagenome TaxID=652676 RepID=A0A3B1B5D1_9ZZZZ
MNKDRLMQVIVSPVISEKSTNAAEESNQFVFHVLKNASKPEIGRAVELMFDVEVEQVRVLNGKGKTKRHGAIAGCRSDWKKAYIKLKPGHDIDFGAGA